ncbi:hypothetical protein U737_21400 [Methylomonas sp. LW13]|uniref:hypothetical protein n=1 Tax=unclassified Methylomonas TaxID=2608980 RepID=UPI00051C3041|nr:MULTISPECIES: hypothetical protein [unclassified Methylomonas]PKD39012.1 hypothetical protein CWO84_18390 [Methylomonas sp. Kb3]QBC29262.1 hypothetical protein U737_21400 [Methylomonas sp. LW13]
MALYSALGVLVAPALRAKLVAWSGVWIGGGGRVRGGICFEIPSEVLAMKYGEADADYYFVWF